MGSRPHLGFALVYGWHRRNGVGLLQACNALIWGLFWLFYASIIFQLAIGTLQFARMILLPPHTSET